jgi:hypothetical protein
MGAGREGGRALRVYVGWAWKTLGHGEGREREDLVEVPRVAAEHVPLDARPQARREVVQVTLS